MTIALTIAISSFVRRRPFSGSYGGASNKVLDIADMIRQKGGAKNRGPGCSSGRRLEARLVHRAAKNPEAAARVTGATTQSSHVCKRHLQPTQVPYWLVFWAFLLSTRRGYRVRLNNF